MQKYIKFRKEPNNLWVFSNFAASNAKGMRYKVILFLCMVLCFTPVQAVRCINDKEALKHNTTMKRIFLCSSFADVASVLSESVAIPLKGKTVAFIPTASIHEEYTQYVEDGRAALDALGLIVKELEITQCSKNEIEEVLTNCDCIYVSGGNTFFLMQELRRTGADRYITEQVGKGKLYIGESAGAMILAPNIEYAKDMDDHLALTPGFTDFGGLGIVSFYPVVHFDSFPFEEAARKIVHKNSHLPLKIITNQQAIAVVGDSIVIKDGKKVD